MPSQQIESEIPQLHVLVNGAQLPQKAYSAILEAVIESSLHLPDACTIRIHDHHFEWLDSGHWKEGNEIKIEVGQGTKPLEKVFEGEVTTIEVDMAAMGVVTLTVRCMDKAHRLHRGRKRQTWQQITDSQIVQEIAGKNGMTVQADSTTNRYEWVIQNNQTDWEFLQFLAQRNGYRVYLEERTRLCFKKMDVAPATSIPLEWGHDLRSFRVRVNNSNQVGKVTVRSWDPKTKQAIVASATQANGGAKIGQRSEGGNVARAAFGDAEMVVVDRPVRTQGEAQQMAQSVCDDIGSSFIEADGLCYNKPELGAGDKVEIKNIGQRFNGTYVVTAVTHTISAAEGLSTQFTISGKEPSTLMSVLGGGGGGGGGAKTPSKGSPNSGSIVIGIVTNNKDPMNMGRVKVKIPALADNLETDWFRIASPMGGAGRGFFYLPEVNDEVLIAFENGDVHQGYIIGNLWNGKDAPPGNAASIVQSDGKVRHRRIKSRSGQLLDFDEDGRIVMQGNSGQRLVLNDKDKCAALRTDDGLEFRADQDTGQIAIFTPSGEVIGLDDKKRKITLTDQMGNFIELDGMAGAISVSAVTTLNIKSTGPINVSGAMVNINSGPVSASKTSYSTSKDKTKPMENA